MAQPIRLSDVFLSPNFGTTEPQCMVYTTGALDELEYGLGVERGWLLGCISRESKHFDIIWEEMNEDILGLIMGGQMALLPDPDSISKMLTLLHHNFYCPLNERRPFYKDLPFMEYTYTLLPPVLPSPQPLYVKDNDAFPSPLPLTEAIVKIQSRLHPLILLDNAAFYALALQSYPDLQHIVDQKTFHHLIRASVPSFGLVQESWLNLGDVEGNKKYARRHVVCYRPDLVGEVDVKKKDKGKGKTNKKAKGGVWLVRKG